ncbi:MAG: NUDIX domain-containing protein [Bryobacterales bacterium]
MLVERQGRLLMRQRPVDAGVMPGFWEAPYVEGQALGTNPFSTLGIEIEEKVGQFRHGIMFRSYAGVVYQGRLEGAEPEDHRWLSVEERAEAPVSTITKKAHGGGGMVTF